MGMGLCCAALRAAGSSAINDGVSVIIGLLRIVRFLLFTNELTNKGGIVFLATYANVLFDCVTSQN